MTEIGKLGEQLVAQWLMAKGWSILAHRWHCRWGEIDLIAQEKDTDIVAFVEVKTRGSNNWDAGGILAITHQKQAKLLRTAKLFLTKHPHVADLPCRFDVALVSYKQRPLPSPASSRLEPFNIGAPVVWQGYQLTLQKYVESAFEAQ